MGIKRVSVRTGSAERAVAAKCGLRRAVRFAVESMEQRVMFTAAPGAGAAAGWGMPVGAAGGRDDGLVATTPPVQKHQVFYIDAAGAGDVDYHGPVEVDDVDVPAYAAPSWLAGQERQILQAMVTSLNSAFPGWDVDFTTRRPAGGDYSTIYLGGDGQEFAKWGHYYGLAEKLDVGDADPRDDAMVFTDAMVLAGRSVAAVGRELADYVGHEAGHLLGFAHADDDHGAADAKDPLAAVAFDPKVHVSIGQDAVADVLDDGKVTIKGKSYAVHPKIVAALRDWLPYYNAGCVGPDGFPDVLMGQFAVHPIDNGTWVTRILDMAWKAQTDPTFSAAEKSQILAYSYGYVTHSTGDSWAHTLVNEFAEGTAPGFLAAAVSIPSDQRDLANMLRHFMTEAYITDAMPGVDTNPDRTEIKNAQGQVIDVSDDSSPGISYEAPIRFIYESLIRPFPDDPTSVVEMKWDDGTLVASTAKTFTRTKGSFVDDGFKVGHKITVSGFSNAANNGTFHVTAVTATTLTVGETLANETASGDEQIVVHVPKTALTTIGVNAAANTFTRTTGSFIDDGFVAGQRFAAYGFNAKDGDFVVKSVTATTLEILGKMPAGDTAGSGDEQLVVYGKRGPLLDELFSLRDRLYSAAVDKGDRGPTGELGQVVANLIDKVVRGQSVPDSMISDLYRSYLYNWVDAIDEGVRHWGELGLAFTRAMFDPQTRRNVQNKKGVLKGLDTLDNADRATAEGKVGLLDILLDQLDDPNGDGSTSDSFINNHLIPMAGLPKELGLLRTGIQSLAADVDSIRAGMSPYNPITATSTDVAEQKPGFIKNLFKKRFGVDFVTFDYLKSLSAKMDLKSLGFSSFTIPIFKPGDRAKLDAMMGLPANSHKPVPSGFNDFPGVDFYPDAAGFLNDNAEFNKQTFAAYADSVTLTKLMLLMETPPDGASVGNGQLSAVFSDLTGTAYDFKKLNLNGAHGGNVMTATLPGAGTPGPWLASIDGDQVWRANNYTTTTALFRVSTQNKTASPAEWNVTLPAGSYKVYATWMANVTQKGDNLTDPNFPDKTLTPASNASYTIFNGSTSLGSVQKNQGQFATDTTQDGLAYALLGTFNIASGSLKVQLSNLGDGQVIAGPILLEAVSGGARTVVANNRDPQTLAALPPANDYIDSPSSWTDLVYSIGRGNDPLWESALLRPAFRQLFTDWQNGALQFPDLGDATSPDPNTTPIAKQQLPSHATPFEPPIPDQAIVIPIPDSLKQLILDGLDGMVGLVKKVEATPPFNVTLPVLDKSLAQLLDLSGNVDRSVRKPIADYFASDPTPTVGELIDVIKSSGIAGHMDQVTSIFEFDVDLRKTFSVNALKLSLGAAASNVGLSLNGTVDVQAMIKFVDALVADLPKLTFGVDLSADSSVALSDRVYIRADKAVLSADVHATNLNFGAKFGFFDVGVVGGSVDLSTDVTLTFNDPNNDGKITLGEIAGTSLSSLIGVDVAGTLTGSLPIQIQSGLSVTGSPSVGTVAFSSTNLFDPSAYTVAFNGNFADIVGSVTPTSILGVLKQVGAFLQQFKGSAALATKLPFSSKTLGDILDLQKAFTDKLLNFLEPEPGKTSFDTAQELALTLADALGLSPAAIAAKYDGLAKQLTFHVKLTDAFAPTALPLDLGLQLGSLAGLSTSSTINVSASAGIEFTFGVNLAAPAATITGANDAVANGRLTAPAHFSVQVGGDDAVDVTVAADATNNTIDDLVADINAALTAAGSGDTVRAGRNGNKLTFATTGLLTPAALTITADAADPAQTQLGLTGSQSASDTVASRFFIKDASVTGSANLSATDIDALAHLGFLDVGVVNGTGGVTAGFSAALTDPGTDAADGRITLSELFGAIGGDVSTLAPAPTLSGSANLTLPLRVDPNILGADHPVAPAATVTWTDIRDPGTLSVNFNADTSKLLDFQSVSYASVIQAILQAVQYVGSLEKFGFLNQKLPLLNQSVSDLLGAANKLLAKVNAAQQATPARSLQQLETTLEQALGLAPDALTLSLDGKAVKVALSFATGGTQDIPIDIDLATLAGGVPGLSGASHLLDVGGGGKLTVGANAAVNLNIGVDLTNPTSPRPFLYDTSAINLDAKALATNLNFTAAVGPLGLFVKGGTVNLDKDGNPNTPDSATFTAGIFDDNGDGRHYFDELGTDDARLTLIGQAHASLPLFFPTSSQSIGTLGLAITDLSNIGGTTTVTAPNLDAQFNAIDLLGNVGAMVDGLDYLLTKLQAGMDSQVLSRKLPLIGSHLKDAVRFLDEIRTDGIEPLRDSLQDQPPADALKNALFQALGPAGLGVLGDNDGNGTIDLNDVGVALDPSGTKIVFNTRLHKGATPIDVPLGFDIGLPGIGLEVDGGVEASLGFDFRLSFGLSKSDGFFFVTDTRDGTGASVPEIKVDFDATTPDLSATGRLAILQLRATDSTTSPTHFGGSFSIDLTDPNNDGKLTAAELAAGPALSDLVKAKLTANADVNLHLVASFGGSANFPTISTDFALHWAFANASMESPDNSFGGKPTVAFTNVQLNAGEFFSNFAKPILDNVKKVLDPIQPIIDILTTKLPVLSDIKVARNLLDFDKSGDVTILDLVHLYNPNAKLDFVTSLAKTIDLINAIPTNLPNLILNLGQFNIASDLRVDTQLTDTDLGGVVQQNTDSQLTGAAANFKTKLAALNAVPGGGIAFPIIQSPSSIFKLLIGQDVNLFTYDMPTLQATFEFSQFFPIIGPLGARFTGSLGATAHFGFGYDTTGLREYFASPSGQRQISDLLDGLFVSDRKNADGTGADVPEVTLTGGIEAAAEINLGIASAGVSGGIFANIGFDLDDPNNDGKMRLDEMVAQLQRGPMCLFDVHGELTAGLKAYIKFLFSKKTFNIATVKLLDFNYSCPEVAADPDPILATLLPGGVLQLNVGTHAGDRLYGDLSDGDDTFTVSPGSTGSSVFVEAFGFKQEYTGVSSIVGNGGAGNDSILIKDGVSATASLSGGDGDDSLYGGTGAATLDGGLGNDQLSGGMGNDCLIGGDGDDVILGNGGNDRGDGGVGDDVLEGGDGNDTLIGGVGVDAVSGGDGDDSLDGGDGADDLSGDVGADVLNAGIGDDALDGGAGNDSLLGGGGNDQLVGGSGNDTAYGGLGNDTFDGGSGNDQLFGEAGSDSIVGGTGADTIGGGDDADFIDAGAGNDSITGDAGADVINAGADNDFVDAGDGDDVVTGGTGGETIYGGLGNDVIYAGTSDAGGGTALDAHLIYGDGPGITTNGGADRIVGDIGPDTIRGGAGADTISALGGDDVIDGEAGDDSITGGAGNDTITGGDGNDKLYGQEGDDAITGDLGTDTVSGDVGRDLLWGGVASFTREAFLAGGFAADGITPLIVGGATIDGQANDGKDSVVGGIGGDWMFGGGDSDQMYGGDDDDYIDAGAGNDTALGEAGNDVVRGGGNADLVRGGTGIDQVYGDDGDDSLYGDAGDAAGNTAGQRLWGGAGADSLYAFAATLLASEFTLVGDELHGGADDDFLYGNLRRDKLYGDAGGDTIYGDYLAGPAYGINASAATFGAADQMFGDSGEDHLYGGGGSDLVFGGGDSDWLEGQDGADSLYGGTGIDLIVLDTDASYTVAGDVFDGHFGNRAAGDIADDGATDVLFVQGTNASDTILVGESGGQLRVTYNGRVIPATWRGPSGPLVEQFRVSGLGGNDRIEFLSGTGGIDVSGLAARSNDWVGVIDGGAGNDTLIGTGGRDRIDGGRGSDVIQGLGGDDRLYGDGGLGQGDSTDLDMLFGGQGNDDLVGGQGVNYLYAWSRDPSVGQFGVFVDPTTGALHDDDGGGQYVLEDTGMNRMLGNAQADKLFGGTGLDFMYGNGGQDQLYNRDGTLFESLDGGVAGQQWKDYARSTGKVWYVGGSNAPDIITVDFVTEPGALAGHHLVTRLTNNNGNFTFAAQVQLDFEARDDNGGLIWDPQDLVFDPNTLAFGDSSAFAGLLPPEGDFQAIIIDALGGNDQVTVGPTVLKSVWIDGGDGDDRVTIKSGNPILSDPVEGATRNDTRQTAYNLVTDARVGPLSANRVLQGMTLDSPTDVDWYRIRLAQAITGNLVVTGLATTDGLTVQIFDSAGTLLRTSTDGAVSLTGLSAGVDLFVRVADNLVPTVYQLAFAAGATPVKINLAGQTPILRRDIILGGKGNDILTGGSGEDWILGGDGNDVLSGGLDRQASDLIFGEGGDDTFQVVTDQLPVIPGSDRTILPTLTDSFDGGAGNDRVLFLGGDIDRNNKPIPDHVAIRYNTILHRYEATNLVWDIANQRYDTDSTGQLRQLFAFYQAQNVERTVIDTKAGDDEVHADPGYMLGGSEWGISLGAAKQNGTIAALQILGGDGNDSIYGGAMGDVIDGGAGQDFISGGAGNDTITGGSDNDVLAGNTGVPMDRFESVTRNGVSGRNDDSAFASQLGKVTPGQVVDGLTFHLGDMGDWYVIRTPDALKRLGTSQAAYLTSDMIDVRRNNGTALTFFLFAARQVDPNDPNSILPIERPTGVPDYYMIHVVNGDPGDGTGAGQEIPGTYKITFSANLGKTIHVPATQAGMTLNSAQPADQPAIIPLGDINGDGYVDFIGAVQDYGGSLADYHNPGNFVGYPGNASDTLPPSFARIYFGTATPGNFTFPTNAVTLRLPAPVLSTSYFGSQTIFANPADYNGDGIKDIAVAVTRSFRYTANEGPFRNEGVYILFGRASGFSGTIDVIANADVTIRGFAPAPTPTLIDARLSLAGGDVNGDGIDDLLVGNDAAGGTSQGAVHLFLGRSNWSVVTDKQVFSADFSDASGNPSADGFTISNGTTGLWHTSLGKSNQGGHTVGGSMYFGTGEAADIGGGNYDGGSRAGTITSGSISLAGLQSAKLSFKYFLQTEALPPRYDSSAIFDIAKVFISQDGGAFLPLQVKDGATLVDGGASNRWATPSGTIQPGQLDDPTAGFIGATFDLSAYVGHNVNIRFSFTSNSANNNYEGWYVDDVTVTGASLSPANANATFTGTGNFDAVGAAVAAIGDFNGDGKKDFAILGGGDHTPKGKAYIINGRGPGDPAFTSGTAPSVASAIIRADDTFYGFNVRGAGDVDNDGFADLLIAPNGGALFSPRGSTPPSSYLIFGRSNLTGTTDIGTLSSTLHTNRDGGWVALGDVNGDGFADLGAGSLLARPTLAETTDAARHGVGEIFLGRANARTTMSLDAPDLVIEPGKPNYDLLAFRPGTLASPGDVNHDGRADWILADSFGGFARVYFGQALQPANSGGSGGGGNSLPVEENPTPVANPSNNPPSTNPPGLNVAAGGSTPDLGDAFELHGGRANERLSAPRSAGDLNGDGVTDFIVDGVYHSYVLLGPVDLNGRVNAATRANIVFDRSTGDTTIPIQRMGDVNGDGINDLIFVRARVINSFDPDLYELSIGIIFGGANMPRLPSIANANKVITLSGGFRFNSGIAFADERFTVTTLNFNGDANADILIVPQGLGQMSAYMISGKTIMADADGTLNIGAAGEGLPAFVLGRDQTDREAAQYDLFGPRAGGYATDSNRQSLSVTVPGDVNGDGLDDFVIADKGYALDTIAPPIGRAYVFLGRTNFALPVSPVPGVTPTQYNLHQADRIYQGAYFAQNVIALGDVNADGYADFAVGRSREGGANAFSNLLFFYGKANIAGPLQSGVVADSQADQYFLRKAGDITIGRIEAAIGASVVSDGTLWATTGDFNHDGKLDLAIGDPSRSVLDTQGTVLDRQDRGQVYIFYSFASRPTGVALSSADAIISGQGDFDQFGFLPTTGPIDLNQDRTGDLVVGAPGADVLDPTLVAAGGKVYVMYAAPAPVTVPTTGFGTLANQTVTGDGDFLVNPGTGQSVTFKDLDANNDGTPDTADYTLPAVQSERWYRFTTLGDGQANSSIRLSNPAREQATVTLRGADGGLVPGGGTFSVQNLANPTFQVGGSLGKLGVFEFDLTPFLAYVDQPNLLQQVQFQLDYANATVVGGEKLRVFLEQLKGDGVVSAGDGAAAATLAAERPLSAADAGTGIIQIDITAAVRAALAAGKTRIALRLATSSTSVQLDVYHANTAGHQTALKVTTARQQGVLGDLYDAAGHLLVKGLSLISLLPFNAGTYFLRVYNPFGPQPQALPFTIDVVAPAAGAAHPGTDRDEVSGGDGDDTLAGNDGLDGLHGQSGNDTYVGDDTEVIDRQPGEVSSPPPPTQSSGIPVPDFDPVIAIPDVGLRNAIADALGIGHTPGGRGLTRPILTSLLAQIRALDASGRQITDLAGLEWLTNLESLNLSGNNLSRLVTSDAFGPHGLSLLSRLSQLDLSNNRLADSALPAVGALTSLRSLDLDGNLFHSIAPLASLVNLTTLSLDGRVSPLSVSPGTGRGSDVLAKFANPTPAAGDFAGQAVASVGGYLAVADANDDVFGTNVGAIYLYDATTGQLARTLPGTGVNFQFGYSLASIGNYLLVGAPSARTDAFGNNGGIVYVYDVTTGALVSQMQSPFASSGDQFGYSMAVVGQDVLIGAPGDDFGGGNHTGMVYRFNPTSGSLLAIYSNPSALPNDGFGQSVAGNGNFVYVGAPGRDVAGNQDVGAAYILDATTGNVLSTLNNPVVSAFLDFGSAIATIGGNVAVGSPFTNNSTGAVYLFNGSTGAPVRTLALAGATNPDEFGYALTAYDDTLLVVGAPYSFSGHAGAAYVVDTTTGAVVQTYTSPVQSDLDYFGWSVAVAGGDVLIGAPGEHPTGTPVGGATLLKGPRIADLTPLASLANLKSLSLANNRISSIAPLAGLANLERLYLQNNQVLGNLTPLASMPRLVSLALNRNPLDNTSFTQAIPLLVSKLTDFTYDPNQAPTLSPLGPIALPSNGVPLTLTLTGADPDAGDAVFFTATSDNTNVIVKVVGNQLTITPPSANLNYSGVAHITVTVWDGPSAANDWRGRSATRTFDVSVGLAAISGAKYGDANGNGVRDPGEAGIAGWTIFLDTDGDGILDPGETSTTTDADGNYFFSGLAPGNYTVAEVPRAPWFSTTPRKLFSANFTGGATQGFTAGGVSDPWHTTTRHGADAGHSGQNSFYFGSEATGTYDNNTSGTLTSPLIDLRGQSGPVRLDFNHFLTAVDSTFTPANADFQGLGPTQSSADGYSVSGLWHLSQIRGTQAGHSQRFSMYFGSETTNTYGTSATGVLLSPTIDLSSISGTITLNLNYFLQAATSSLGGTIDAATITVIGPGGVRTLIGTNGGKANLGNTAAFTTFTRDLSSFAGQQIQLEFKFQTDSDARNTAEGWYVDDVRVTAVSTDLAQVGVLLPDNSFIPLADNHGLNNLADSTGGFVPVSLDLSAFNGQQFQLQWRFTPDGALNAEGWYVDDVRVTTGVPTQLNLVAGQLATGLDFGGVQVITDVRPDRTVAAGQAVTITPTVTDPNTADGSNLGYAWSVIASNGQIVAGATTPTFTFTPNAPGTYTVTFTVTDHDNNDRTFSDAVVITSVDATPPRITSATFTGPRQLVVQFNENVVLNPSQTPLVLQNLTTGLTIPVAQTSFTYDPVTFRATFTLTSGAAQLLADGNYRATFLSSKIADTSGNPFDGNADGLPGGDYAMTFTFLAGDTDGNRIVNFNDLLTLARNYNKTGMTLAQGDLDGNGTVNFNDLLILARNYNKSLPAGAEVPSEAAPLDLQAFAQALAGTSSTTTSTTTSTPTSAPTPTTSTTPTPPTAPTTPAPQPKPAPATKPVTMTKPVTTPKPVASSKPVVVPTKPATPAKSVVVAKPAATPVKVTTPVVTPKAKTAVTPKPVFIAKPAVAPKPTTVAKSAPKAVVAKPSAKPAPVVSAPVAPPPVFSVSRITPRKTSDLLA